MGFSRQEHWSGLPCPSSGDVPYSGINPGLLHGLLHWRWLLYRPSHRGEAWVGGGTSGAVNQGAAPAPPRLPKAHPWVTQPFPSSGMERGFVRKKERVFPGGKLSVFQSLKISEAPVESKPAGHCSVTRWKKTAPRRGCLEAADKRRNREG